MAAPVVKFGLNFMKITIACVVMERKSTVTSVRSAVTVGATLAQRGNQRLRQSVGV